MPAFATLTVGAARSFTLGDDRLLYNPDRFAPIAEGSVENDSEDSFLRFNL